ncbi:hypothetical protein D3C76_1593290 [compost metagenome]
MITASKPYKSRAGPTVGSKLVRIARNTPAIDTTAIASAMASPKICALLTPISRAVCWSSEVARNARPNEVL